jgi:hypothetical protein
MSQHAIGEEAALERPIGERRVAVIVEQAEKLALRECLHQRAICWRTSA